MQHHHALDTAMLLQILQQCVIKHGTVGCVLNLPGAGDSVPGPNSKVIARIEGGTLQFGIELHCAFRQLVLHDNERVAFPKDPLKCIEDLEAKEESNLVTRPGTHVPFTMCHVPCTLYNVHDTIYICYNVHT